MNKQSWTIGILCYNEEGSIERVTAMADSVLQEISNGDYEILIIDDGSSDSSTSIIHQIEMKNLRVKGVYHKMNKGIGEALRSVYFNATKENVLATAGDGQFDITELKQFPVLQEDEFYSYYRKENITYSSFRVVLSLFNRKLNKFFIGLDIKDINWAKVYKTEVIKKLDLQLHSSLIESEICAKLFYLGFKVREVESKIIPRTTGESKGSSWKIIKKAIFEMITLITIVNKYKKKHPKIYVR